MNCDVCRQETENYIKKENYIICARCYADYLKWQLKREKLDKSLKTFKRKYKKCG